MVFGKGPTFGYSVSLDRWIGAKRSGCATVCRICSLDLTRTSIKLRGYVARHKANEYQSRDGSGFVCIENGTYLGAPGGYDTLLAARMGKRMETEIRKVRRICGFVARDQRSVGGEDRRDLVDKSTITHGYRRE